MNEFVKYLKRALLALPILALLLATAAAQDNHEADLRDGLYQRTMPAVAWIISPTGVQSESQGTGTLVNIDGQALVLTAAHVVGDGSDVELVFPVKDADGTYITKPRFYVDHAADVTIHGQVVARDATRDVALIRPDRLPPGVRPLELATAPAQKDQRVFLAGNSDLFGSLWDYRAAWVVDVGQLELHTDEGVKKASMLLLDGYIDHGDSGGPVFNEQGQVIGVMDASQAAKVQGYAIDVHEVAALLAGTGGTPALPVSGPAH